MAKQEWHLRGNGLALMQYLDDRVMHGSLSASLEDSSLCEANGVRCFLRVYERYSILGSNRVSLSLLLVEHDTALHLTAITAGGSQAVLFKMNTVGEFSFLEKLSDAVAHWGGSYRAPPCTQL